MYKINRADLPALFALLAADRDLYLPLKQGGQSNYGLWNETVEVDLDTLKTVKSPKDMFFPQSENLYTCYREGKKIRITPELLRDRPFVVFGIRGCDVRGIEVLDKVFLEEPADTYYAARREQGILVAMACHEPEESCFCTVFGVNPAVPTADVTTWFAGEMLYWKSQTEKGEKLTQLLAECLLPASDASDKEAVEREQAAIDSIVEKLPYGKLSLNGFDGAHLQELFDSPQWEQLYKTCLACGTCTFVCPTCQCYDIRDYDTGHGIKRFRCWDSCMYSDFTLMAHGNPRTSQLQRFRQRFMHKLVYFPDNHEGMYSCAGCGRCVDKCPSSLNIVKVIKSLGVQEHV